MRLRKAIKRIVALGAGATMLGATIMGAMAADLADYPAPFVKDGLWQSDALIVFGTNAAASDVAGAVDLAVGLQYSAKTKKTVSTAAAGAITISGDAKKVVSGSNNLEFNESVRDIRTSVTSADLTSLADGSISNEYGTPTYTQTIYLPRDAKIVFEADSAYDDKSNALPYLKMVSASTVDDQTYKYEIAFSPAMKSDHNSGGYLEDIRNKKMKILGTDYNIIQADHSALQSLTLTFMAGAVSDTMTEGETKTYTIDGKDYEVTLDYVGSSEVKFTVNGETTLALAEAQTHKLSDGTEVGVVDIMAQEFAGGLRKVEFNLGANKLKCTDANTSNSTSGGTVTIGSTDMGNMKCEVVTSKDDGTATGADVEITTINFKYSSGSDLLVAEKGSASAKAEIVDDEKGNFMNNAFDFRFEGLELGKTEEISLIPSGSYNYKLKFTNKAGVSYNQEVFGLDGTTMKFGRYTGSVMYDLVTNEKTAIADEYYFVVSKNEYSRIMQFKDIVPGSSTTDNTGTVRLKDTGSGDLIDVSYSLEGAQRVGYLRVDGNEFKLNVTSDTNSGTIMVDFDGGGTIADVADWCPQLFTQYGANITLCGWRNATGVGGFIDAPATYGENAMAVTTEMLEGGSNREIVLMGVILNSDGKIDLNDSAHVRSATITGKSYDTTSLTQKTDGSYVYQWYSRYGVFVEVDRIGSGATQNQLKLVYPDNQVFGAFFVTSGKTTASSTEGGEGVVTYYETNPIGVGMAKLASEVADLSAYNLILVGGPCANEAARSVMGVTEAQCLDGFEQGKALLKIYDNNGKVALLVAGYSAADTKKATTVLTNHGSYALSGTEMEVTGTSLSELTVAAPTPAATE